VPKRLESIERPVRFVDILYGIVVHETGFQADREQNERSIDVLTAHGKGGVFL
jgi:hypothetical protein